MVYIPAGLKIHIYPLLVGALHLSIKINILDSLVFEEAVVQAVVGKIL